MNPKGTQTHQLLAALGACLAAMILVGPAAAKHGAGVIENQRQLELASDQAFQVSPYLSHGILSASDGIGFATQRDTPDGYQPQLGSGAGDAAVPASLRDRPDGYQPQLGVSELGVVADEGFDWMTTGFAASIMAAMLVVAAGTFTYGSRRRYRSA